MTHEFGHSLGMHHSKSKKSVMAPHYVPYTRSFHLFKDDIKGIQSMYGWYNTMQNITYILLIKQS